MTRVLVLATCLLCVASHGIAQVSAALTNLSFGKEQSVRSSIPMNPATLGPGATLLTSAPGTTIAWETPSTGSLYASVAVGPIGIGTLLTADLLPLYGCQSSVIYEAPNHPFIIQSMLQGGTVNVGGTICGSTPAVKDFSSIEYGRRKIVITAANNTIQAGTPTVVVFILPPNFTPLSMIRIDFGTEVSAFGETGRIFTVPITLNPLAVAVTYPADYHGESVGVEAIATTGTFIETSPISASGSGVLATGATVSNAASFKVVKAASGSLTVALLANRRLVRRNGQVNYTYTITNGSAVALSNVQVWDNQFGNIDQRATLGPGGTMISNNSPALTSTTKNHAIVTASDPFGKTVTAESNEVEVRVIDPAIRITVWVTPGRAVKVGQQATVNYQVDNIGDAPLGPVTIRDLTDAFTFPPIPRLEQAASTTLQRIITIRAEDKTRQAQASAVVIDDPAGPDVEATDDETLDIRTPQIGLSLAVDKNPVKLNTDVTLTATVSNLGDADLYNISVALDGQSIGTVQELTAHTQTQMNATPQTMIATKTLSAVVTAVDNWQDAHTATAQITVNVINPALKVSVKANGAKTKVKVKKGSTVQFDYTIQNNGNCELRNVKLLVDGNEAARFDILPANAVKSVSSAEVINDDVINTVRGMGSDPNGDQLAETDKIVVEAEGFFAGIGITVDFVKKLLNDIDIYKQKIESLSSEFKAGIKQHAIDKTNPCDDGRLSTMVQEAQTYLKLYEDAIAELQKQSTELIKIAASNPDLADLLDLVTKALGGVSQRIKGLVDDMKTEWANLNCGEPIKKDHIVNVTVSVQDENGNALSGASVRCDRNDGRTGANGQAVFTLALSKDEVVDATASFTTNAGYTANGNNSAKFSSGDYLLIPITLNTSPVLKVTVTGKVVDKNNRPLTGAMISVEGGAPVPVDASGNFTVTVDAKPGTKLTIVATVKNLKGKAESASTSVVVGSDAVITTPVIVIKNADAGEQSSKKATGISITPTDPKLKVEESISLDAKAVYDDNSNGTVTSKATWSSGSNTFKATVPGSFIVTATYEGFTASTTIIVSCPDGEEWNSKLNKCISLSSAIEDTKNNSGDDLCDIKLARRDFLTLVALVADLNDISSSFKNQVSAFNKHMNDQKSDPCKNQLLAAALAGAERYYTKGESVIENIAEKASELMMKLGICPGFEMSTEITSVMITEMLRMTGSTKGKMKQDLADMKARLMKFGCDPNEVSQLGNTLAENTGNLHVTGDGGNGGTEICGDGVDNNANGLIDEGCASQTNSNVVIYLFDSGRVKDDIFNLSVAGRTLGQNPKGGRTEFGVTLNPGSYTATLLVIEDGDASGSCCGTFVVTITQGSTILASQTGDERKGTVINIPFTVASQKFTRDGNSDSFMPDFDRVLQQEGNK